MGLRPPSWQGRHARRKAVQAVSDPSLIGQDDPTDARRPVSYYVTILTLMLAAALGVVVTRVA
jgi:hypothetical protein